MSLVAPLLSLPGRLRKLRAHNVPAFPITPQEFGPQCQITGSKLSTQYTPQYWVPSRYSNKTTVNAQNNASQTDTEVANITGKGAVDAIWLNCFRTSSSSGTWSVTYGVSVLVDGVEIVPTDWRFSVIGFEKFAAVVGVLGVAFIEQVVNILYEPLSYVNKYEKASAPIPFDESLVVTLKHYSTDTSSSSNVSSLKTSCYVNAWKTK